MSEKGKLIIEAHEKDDFGSKIKEFVAQRSPENFSINLGVNLDRSSPHNSSKEDVAYKNSSAGKLSFKLNFDNSLDKKFISKQKLSKKTVDKLVKELKAVVYNYNGKIHQPNFLKIIWGGEIFKGLCESFTIDYSNFQKSGLPQNASVSLSFVEVIPVEERKKIERTSSPDLTHSYTVLQGDTLPQIAKRVYGDEGLYIELARFNKLLNFRSLEPGVSLVLPPLLDE